MRNWLLAGAWLGAVLGFSALSAWLTRDGDNLLLGLLAMTPAFALVWGTEIRMRRSRRAAGRSSHEESWPVAESSYPMLRRMVILNKLLAFAIVGLVAWIAVTLLSPGGQVVPALASATLLAVVLLPQAWHLFDAPIRIDLTDRDVRLVRRRGVQVVPLTDLQTVSSPWWDFSGAIWRVRWKGGRVRLPALGYQDAFGLLAEITKRAPYVEVKGI